MKLHKTNKEQYTVTLPKTIVESFKWNKGDIVEWSLAYNEDNEQFILRNITKLKQQKDIVE